MSEQPKSTDAEDILSEFNKDTQPKEKPVQEQTTNSTTDDDQIKDDSTTDDVHIKDDSTTDDVQIKDDSTTDDVHVENKSKEKYSDKPRDVIFVGKKPLMTYVNSTLTQLSVSPVVTITSRGKSITLAVDVSQFIMKRMDTVGYFIKDVRISSDSLKSNDGKSRNVSTIEIDISHK